MVKFYAVKKGKCTGIFSSWEEAKEQVIGFPGAQYKSFSTVEGCDDYMRGSITLKKENKGLMAKEIIMGDNDSTAKYEMDSGFLLAKDDEFKVYTDGCHFKHENPSYLGIGAYGIYKGKEYYLSQTVDEKLLETYCIECKNVSNPTAEFLAFAQVLQIISNIKDISQVKITFYIDYVGVQHWMNGSWMANKEYIKKIKDYCIDLIASNHLQVSIIHVKGHTGNYGNEIADKLSKNKEIINTFINLFS